MRGEVPTAERGQVQSVSKMVSPKHVIIHTNTHRTQPIGAGRQTTHPREARCP
jgi:hypothetical protein